MQNDQPLSVTTNFMATRRDGGRLRGSSPSFVACVDSRDKKWVWQIRVFSENARKCDVAFLWFRSPALWESALLLGALALREHSHIRVQTEPIRVAGEAHFCSSVPLEAAFGILQFDGNPKSFLDGVVHARLCAGLADR